MRKTEPPVGRGSATKFGLILRRCGAKSTTNWISGSRTSRSKRSRFSSNHGRLLFSFSSRRKLKRAGLKWVVRVAVAAGAAGIDRSSLVGNCVPSYDQRSRNARGDQRVTGVGDGVADG